MLYKLHEHKYFFDCYCGIFVHMLSILFVTSTPPSLQAMLRFLLAYLAVFAAVANAQTVTTTDALVLLLLPSKRNYYN